ncbi:hypothetical protein EDB92DRAFT_1797317 [Lactarius akahatsu]|uniref:RRM domain-containing protein n=1 Tax=Lactarius akahatsu TaxID=416441 RepID=A0AAD4Q8J1_9AGAM|nr:hypothetical protein EDB92DRAFT_1797317 [Lactarius akahatsu]
MPSDQPARLTKKQKKATAFRERSKGKGKLDPVPRRSRTKVGDHGGDDDDDDANAVPAMEDQAPADIVGDAARNTEGDKRRVKAPKTASLGAVETTKKKRRREDGEAQPGPVAKRARSSEKIPTVADGAGAGVNEPETGNEGSKQRFILFVGNLKYTTTREAIQSHFSVCDPPPTVRLLTPKVTRTGTTVAKSKGCAFLEFSTRPTLQAALRLHQSELDGRRINVELTAGGGGKGDARLAKLKARNKELAGQRVRLSPVLRDDRIRMASERGEGTALQESLQPQRFSTTSGEGDVPHTKRTWTVSDGDHGGNHEGEKTKKKRGARTKSWGTGVNALPIG